VHAVRGKGGGGGGGGGGGRDAWMVGRGRGGSNGLRELGLHWSQLSGGASVSRPS